VFDEPRPAQRDTSTVDVVMDQPMAVTPATTAATTAAATAAVQGLSNTGASDVSTQPRYEETRGTTAGGSHQTVAERTPLHQGA
jgi:hypothetical protein